MAPAMTLCTPEGLEQPRQEAGAHHGALFGQWILEPHTRPRRVHDLELARRNESVRYCFRQPEAHRFTRGIALDATARAHGLWRHGGKHGGDRIETAHACDFFDQIHLSAHARR
jgi:hypothetical protein